MHNRYRLAVSFRKEGQIAAMLWMKNKSSISQLDIPDIYLFANFDNSVNHQKPYLFAIFPYFYSVLIMVFRRRSRVMPLINTATSCAAVS